MKAPWRPGAPPGLVQIAWPLFSELLLGTLVGLDIDREAIGGIGGNTRLPGREQITSRGIGNGISLIILSGIVAELPSALASMLELGRQGEIPVDRFSQTAVPSVFAVGDVTGRINLTPVAIREGHAFADTVFGKREVKVDHADIPTAVFTQPQVGTVGLTEAQARK